MPLAHAHVAPLSFPDPVAAEFAKDIWDARCIPGTRYSPCRSVFLLNFTDITPAFRPVVKRHIQLMLMKYSVDHCRNKIRHLETFLDFFLLRRPGVAHFQQVDRADIEAYLIYLRTERGKHWSEQEMIYALSTLFVFPRGTVSNQRRRIAQHKKPRVTPVTIFARRLIFCHNLSERSGRCVN